jgi:transcription elongation factor GreA
MVSGLTLGLTADGMQQLVEDLAALQERRAILTESLVASPDDASSVLTQLALVERRLAEVQDVLARAEPLDQRDRVPGVVGVGSRVIVHWDEDGEETYTIVEPAEVALSAGRISYESPVGEALMGRRAGDRVAVTPHARQAWLEVIAVV